MALYILLLKQLKVNIDFKVLPSRRHSIKVLSTRVDDSLAAILTNLLVVKQGFQCTRCSSRITSETVAVIHTIKNVIFSNI